MIEIQFSSAKMQKTCSSDTLMKKAWGNQTAAKLQQRLAELESFDSLADASLVPSIRCHELKGNRKGQLAIDLVHPHRLIFMPNHQPLPCKADGGLDWEQVTSIVVIEVVDYH